MANSQRYPAPPSCAEPEGAKRGFGLEVDLQRQPIPKSEQVKRFGPCVLATDDVRTAIILLASTEKHIVIESLQSLHKFCKQCLENREIFMGLGGVAGVLKLMHSSNQIIQRLSMKLIAMSSAIREATIYLRNHNVTQEMLYIALDSRDDVVAEYASVVLLNLAKLFSTRILLIKINAFAILVEIANRPDPDIQKNALEAIQYLLEESLHALYFLRQASVDRIVELVESEHASVQLLALSVLEKVARTPEGVHRLAQNAFIGQLGNKLLIPDIPEVHRIVLRILIDFTANSSACTRIFAFMTQFNLILDTSKDVKILARTVTLFGKLSRIPTNAAVAVDSGIPEKVVNFVGTHDSVEVREAAVWTLTQLAFADFRAKALLIDGLAALVSLFPEKNLSTFGQDTIILGFTIILEAEPRDICNFDFYQEEFSPISLPFVEEGGLKIVLKVLAEQAKYSDSAIVGALTCVTRLGHRVKFCKRILEGGALPSVLNCFKSKNPRVLHIACSTLAVLVAQGLGRSHFISNAGWNYIIDAVKWPDHRTIVSLAPLLDTLAAYKDIGEKLIDNGILQALCRHQDFFSPDSIYTSIVDQLVQSHLPAKYALTGHIDFFEVLPNGFYDCGVLPRTETFVPLHELLYGEPPLRRVIYLDLERTVEQDILASNPSLELVGGDELPLIQAYAEELRRQIDEEDSSVQSERQLVALIASFVANKLGGPTKNWRVDTAAEECELENMQRAHESVAVPLSMFQEGTHRTRALLFKALADMLGVAATLQRRNTRSWNVVFLRTIKKRRYVIPAKTPAERIKVCRQDWTSPEVDVWDGGKYEEYEDEPPELNSNEKEWSPQTAVPELGQELDLNGEPDGEKQGDSGLSIMSARPDNLPEVRRESKKRNQNSRTDSEKRKPSLASGESKERSGFDISSDKQNAGIRFRGINRASLDKRVSVKFKLNEVADENEEAKQKENKADIRENRAKMDEKMGRGDIDPKKFDLDGKRAEKEARRDEKEQRRGRKEEEKRGNGKKGVLDSSDDDSDSSDERDEPILMFDNDRAWPPCGLDEGEGGLEEEEEPTTEGVGPDDEFEGEDELEGEDEDEDEEEDDWDEGTEVEQDKMDDIIIPIAPPIRTSIFPDREFKPFVILDKASGRLYEHSEKLRRYVVDLLFEPGELFEVHSEAAHTYTGDF